MHVKLASHQWSTHSSYEYFHDDIGVSFKTAHSMWFGRKNRLNIGFSTSIPLILWCRWSRKPFFFRAQLHSEQWTEIVCLWMVTGFYIMPWHANKHRKIAAKCTLRRENYLELPKCDGKGNFKNRINACYFFHAYYSFLVSNPTLNSKKTLRFFSHRISHFFFVNFDLE